MRVVGLAEFTSRCRNSVQYWLEVIGGARDDGEHLRCRGLVFKRLLQSALARLLRLEQARILDGDDGLVGKGLEQINLAVCEGAQFLTVDSYHADNFAFLQHWYRYNGSRTGKINQCDECGIAINVGLLRCEIDNVNYLFVEAPA
jgi:hypothetical protein